MDITQKTDRISWNKKERKTVFCACGCKKTLISVSKGGQDRRFIHGHNKPMLGKKRIDFVPWNKGKKGLQIGWSKGMNFPQRKGSGNPNWKGGVSLMMIQSAMDTQEYKSWRRFIFERDSFTCQRCGTRGKIEAHHKLSYKNYPSLRLDIDNGITLCKKCHKVQDKITRKIERFMNENKITLESASVEQLKSFGYDLIVQLQDSQAKLNQINTELSKRANDARTNMAVQEPKPETPA